MMEILEMLSSRWLEVAVAAYLHRDTFIDSRRLKGSGVLSDQVIHFPITVSFYYKTLLTSPTTR